jgi:hypothetical protein
VVRLRCPERVPGGRVWRRRVEPAGQRRDQAYDGTQRETRADVVTITGQQVGAVDHHGGVSWGMVMAFSLDAAVEMAEGAGYVVIEGGQANRRTAEVVKHEPGVGHWTMRVRRPRHGEGAERQRLQRHEEGEQPHEAASRGERTEEDWHGSSVSQVSMAFLRAIAASGCAWPGAAGSEVSNAKGI